MRVLVVEDEVELSDLLSRRSRQHAMVVDVAGCLADAQHVARSERYHAIILDRMLPDGDRLSAIPDLRRHQPQASIAVLTAQGDIVDRVTAANSQAALC